MRGRILVIPAIADLGSFCRLVADIGHYFSHVAVERVVIHVEKGVLREVSAWLRAPSTPVGFGDAVVERIGVVRDRIEIRAWPREIDALAVASDLVLVQDGRGLDREPWSSTASRYRLDRTLFRVDWQSVRARATGMAEAARILAQGRPFDRSQSQAVGDLIERLGRTERAYVVGPEASARLALGRDLSDGVRITCDNTILDEELLAHVRPHVLTLDDPQLHFGPSTFAQRFRKALVEQARRYDFAVATTERFAPLLRAIAPEIAHRVIGLREGSPDWPDSFDLLTHPAVRPYPNVLTMLMLPLAATMARSIDVIGFDDPDPRSGRDLGHRSTAHGEVADVRLVPPGFVETSFSAAYDHAATVERVISSLEERGLEIRPMATSTLPALRRRSTTTFEARRHSATDPRPTLVSLTPDWIDDFGHYGPFERRIHEVAEGAGHVHVTLASAGLQPTAGWQLPTFSEPTVSAGRRLGPVGWRFERELRAALEHLHSRPGAVVFLYTGDVWHLPAILGLASDHADLQFVVNLMRSHGWIERATQASDPWIEGLVDLLGSCIAIASRINVEVAVDTEALARDVELLTGQRVVVWPMISVSGISHRRVVRRAAGGGPHIVAPVQAQGSKGFPDLVALAERVRGRLERRELRLTARWPTDGTYPQLLRLAERFEEQGGRLVRGNLTDEEFVALIASADVALIPYRLHPFRTRTSAVTLDVLLAGKPVVAVHGTWAGDLIEHYGAGLTYADGNVAEMDSAISQVISDIDAYQRRVAEIRGIIAAEHAPERLIEFLSGAQGSPEPDANVRGPIADLHERAYRMRRLFQWHVTAEDATRMSAFIREDDQQRTLDTLRDEIDELKRAISHRDRARIAAASTARPGSGPDALA